MVRPTPRWAAISFNCFNLGKSSEKTRLRFVSSKRGCNAESLTDTASGAATVWIACRYRSKYRAASSAVRAASPSMSYEKRYGRRVAPRAAASAMVSATTNWPARMRIAWRTAARTTGSPRRATRYLTAEKSSSAASCQRASVPVSMRAQSAALAELQLPEESLSRISASAVSGSGMRSSASATHISATPSRVESPYCRRNDSALRAPGGAARTRSAR